MRKKAGYTAIAAGMMVMALTGCGSSESKNQTEVQTEAVTTENIQTETAHTDSEEASSKEATEVVLADGMLQVKTASLGDQVAFIDYDSNGTAMQVMLYKDGDGKLHGAFNTCQVCAGSPYAYFEQEGNDVVCQNCGNHFSVNEIGVAHGGCNPVPLEFSQDGENVLIDTAVLDEQADAFQNWKKGI